jgi:acyl dehydratase
MTNLLHFQDFPLGRTFAGGPYHVTKEEIVEFALQFDPQPHHLDEEAAARSMLHGLSASGWHTCAMTMRMLADSLLPLAAARGGVGAREARWIKPVRPGDILRIEAEVVARDEPANHPDLGYVTFDCRVFNRSEQVALVSMTPIIAKRSGA